MATPDVVDQLVPDIPEYWLRGAYAIFGSDGKLMQYKTCTIGSINSVLPQTLLTIGFLLIGRVLNYLPIRTPLRSKVIDFTLFLLSLLTLSQWIEEAKIFRLALTFAIIAAIVIKYVRVKYISHLITVAVLSSILFIEYKFSRQQFNAARGVLIILGMKISAFAYQFATFHRRTSLLNIIVHFVSPATLPFGPVVSFDTHLRSYQKKFSKSDLNDFINGSIALILSFTSLSVSNCATSLFLPKCLSAFGTALAFRFSHYFISYLSEAFAFYSGNCPVLVTNPEKIELPWSMRDVVIFWNFPMHNYLKQYVFKNLRNAFPAVVAAFGTFFVSTLFHGLDVQIGIVLLSLAAICFVEQELRFKLHFRLLTITARRRHPYLYKLFNVFLLLLNVFHLTYLGMVFDGSHNPADTSAQHARKSWRSWYYASPAITGFLFLVAKAFPFPKI